MEMIEVKVSDLNGSALDWAVGHCEGHNMRLYKCPIDNVYRVAYTPHDSEIESVWHPHVSWWLCGQLIEKYRVSIIYSDETCDPCAWTDDTAPWHGSTPLIAAIRAIVAHEQDGLETIKVPACLVR